jgi:hypothetical protein
MTCGDALISRERLTMAENRLLRSELGRLGAEHQRARDLLQALIFENASLRAEARSMREEMIYRRSVRPHGFLYPPFCLGLFAASDVGLGSEAEADPSRSDVC